MTVLIIATSVWVVILSLIVLWIAAVQLENGVRFKMCSYGINLAHYNDYVQALCFKDKLSTEEELRLLNMQEDLSTQAKDLGIPFVPFQRPRGSD